MDEASIPKPLYGIGCLGIIVLFFGLWSIIFNNVGPGEVGVMTTWGHVESGTLQPGFHWAIPIAQSIHTINTRVQNVDFNDIDAATREQQSVKLTGKVRFTIDSTRAFDLYQKVGTEDVEGRLIDPDLQTYIKSVTVEYNAFCGTASVGSDGKAVPVDPNCKALLNNRQEVGERALAKVKADLAQYGIDVDAVLIKNVNYSKDFEAAIEAKQKAAQDVETAKQAQAKAQIDAQTALINAQGKANANNAEKVSLTPELLQKLEIDKELAAINKWDGKLPTYYGGSSGGLFFNIPK